MTKEEIKNYLIENGANVSLIKMPAIIERIYACYDIDSKYNLITGSFYETNINLSESIIIDDAGNITLSDGLNTRIFKAMSNGEAIYINKDETGYSIDEQGEYLIDESGMDISYSNGSDHTAKRQEDSTVDVDGLRITDNGSPILNLYDLLNSKGEKTWEKNRSFLTNEYPSTRKWFEQKKQEFKVTGSDEKSPELNQQTNDNVEINKLKARVDSLKKENIRLRRSTVPKNIYDELRIEKRRAEIERNIFKTQVDEQRSAKGQIEKQMKEQQNLVINLQRENELNKQEIQKLRVSNQNFQRMLKTTLDFCENVKNSFLGRVFFGSKLKQLPSGIQTQEQQNVNEKQEEQVR